MCFGSGAGFHTVSAPTTVSNCEYNFFKLRNHLHFGNFINLAEDYNAPVENKN